MNTAVIETPGQRSRTTFSAFLVDNRNMEPIIRLGAVVFVGDLHEYRWDNLYAFPTWDDRDGPPGQVYRVSFGPKISLSLDNSGPRYEPHNIPRSDFMEMRWWPVAGFANPNSSEFEQFLRERFLGGESWPSA